MPAHGGVGLAAVAAAALAVATAALPAAVGAAAAFFVAPALEAVVVAVAPAADWDDDAAGVLAPLADEAAARVVFLGGGADAAGEGASSAGLAFFRVARGFGVAGAAAVASPAVEAGKASLWVVAAAALDFLVDADFRTVVAAAAAAFFTVAVESFFGVSDAFDLVALVADGLGAVVAAVEARRRLGTRRQVGMRTFVAASGAGRRRRAESRAGPIRIDMLSRKKFVREETQRGTEDGQLSSEDGRR